MRILIVSLPRTGSTSLLDTISKSKNLKSLFEPFDGSNRYHYSDDMDNIVLKTIVSVHHPKEVTDFYTWIIEFTKKFDEIILLTRRDLKACAESHAFEVYNRKKGHTSTQEYFWEETPIDDLCYSNIIKWNNTLTKLSVDLNIPLTYYEDLYDLNNKNRLRKGNRNEIKSNII
jgi:hypothetical protein